MEWQPNKECYKCVNKGICFRIQAKYGSKYCKKHKKEE